jgi:hypothetical protein
MAAAGAGGDVKRRTELPRRTGKASKFEYDARQNLRAARPQSGKLPGGYRGFGEVMFWNRDMNRKAVWRTCE